MRDISQASLPDDLARFDREIIPAARKSYPLFVATCFRDEQRRRIEVAPFQYEWLRLLYRYRNVVIWSPPEHGKSMHFSVFIPLWVIAHRPNHRIVVVSATAHQAMKFGRVVRETIERNRVFQRVFPHVRPGKPWTDTILTVKREAISKDPTIQCIGIDGAILGARVDLLILDDVLTPQNTYSETQREKVFRQIEAAFITRLTEDGRIVAIGVPWHPRDAYHRLVAELGFVERRYPAVLNGKPLWPARWSLERLEIRRSELTLAEWRRQYLLDLTPTASVLFQAAWIEEARQRGRSIINPREYRAGEGERLVCGLDFGAGGGRSAVHVLGVSQKMRTTLMAQAGHFSGTEIRDLLRLLCKVWPGLVVAAENNATQALILDLLRDSLRDVVILPFRTDRRVYDPSGEIHRISQDFASGCWRIAATGDKGIEEWLTDLLSYRGGHMPDTLAACVFARAVGLTLAGQREEGADVPERLGMIAWGSRRSLVALHDDGRIEIMADDGRRPQFVVGMASGQSKRWPAEFVPCHWSEVLKSREGLRKYRQQIIVVRDEILKRDIAALGPYLSRADKTKAAMIALELAVRAAELLQVGAGGEERTDEPEPRVAVRTGGLTWEQLTALGMPGPDFLDVPASMEEW